MLERRSIVLLVAIVMLTLVFVAGCISTENTSLVIDFTQLFS